MSPLLEHYAVMVAVALLATGTVAGLIPATSDTMRHRIATGALAGVVAALGIAIAGRWLRESQGPFLTMYDVLLSNTFSLGLVFIVATGVSEGLRPTSRIVLPLLFGMGVWLTMVPAEAVPLPATFDNPWLWVHVLSGKVFLGLCLVCAAAAVMQLASPGDASEDGNAALWSMYFIAFMAHTVMLVAGAAWAHTAWGRFWSWDGLEVSTLLTWLLIGGTLHARVTFRTMQERVALGLVVGSFVLAFLTFFGLPFLSIGPHKGFV